MKKIKVLFFSEAATYGGAPRVLHNIVKHLDRSKFTPICAFGNTGVITTDFLDISKVYVFEKYPLSTGYRIQKILLPARKKLWFRRIVDTEEPDIIYHNALTGEDIMRIEASFSIPKIVHIHSLLSEIVSKPIGYQDFLSSYANKYICCSYASAHNLELLMGVPKEKIETVHTGLSLNQFSQESKINYDLRKALFIDNDALLIGGGGVFEYHKGIDLFVEAAFLIKEKYPSKKIKFIWIGGDYQSTGLQNLSRYGSCVIQYAHANGLEDDFLFVGQQNRYFDFLRMINIFVLPSRQDALPLVVLEAMSLGIPVIAFAVGGLGEIIHNNNGVLVTPESPMALSAGICELIEHPERAYEIGKASITEVIEKFDIEKNIKLFENSISNTVSTANKSN